jgi:hypothetical protein
MHRADVVGRTPPDSLFPRGALPLAGNVSMSLFPFVNNRGCARRFGYRECDDKGYAGCDYGINLFRHDKSSSSL